MKRFYNVRTNTADAEDTVIPRPNPAANNEPQEKKEPRLPIGREELLKAGEIFEKYRRGKAALDNKIIANYDWFNLRNWKEGGDPRNQSDPKPNSAWLFNSLANKHADAMDNLPAPIILARSKDDEKTAEILSKVIPCVLERAGYEQVYSREWWRKLINGAAIYSTIWDPVADDVAVCGVDPLSIYWQPGVSDIQDSANVFVVKWYQNDALVAQYPELEGKLGGQSFVKQDVSDADIVDHTEDSLVTDWYYRKNGDVHFCKFIGENVLFSSENKLAEGETQYAEGYYADGEYPFDFDNTFPKESSPFGFGQVDISKDTQMYIDKLGSLILKNAAVNARTRYFVSLESGINEEEFADTSNELVHVNDARLSEDAVRRIESGPLDGVFISIYDRKIEELKETSGNRDFAQGSTSAGVTSGSAIAALQEAGNKLSRDQLKSSYATQCRIFCKVIERMRQFYDTERYFRITGTDGKSEYIAFDPSRIAERPVSESNPSLGSKRPIFDIKVKAQKASSFSREIQNQRATEMYAQGFFAPERAEQALMAIGMMDFEGKDEIEKKISEQAMMFRQMQELQRQVAELGQMVASLAGGPASGKMPEGGASTSLPDKSRATPVSDGSVVANGAGDAVRRANTSAADAMRKRVQNGASPA